MQPTTADRYADLARDHDRWRQEYDTLTFEDQKQVYEWIRYLYPNQRSFTAQAAYRFFNRYEPRTVSELGGWDGFLAACVLGQHPEITGWTNYELVEVPQSCVDARYRLRVLSRQLWDNIAIVADAFVATHTIEHLRAHEVDKLVSKLRVAACLIEAPLADGPTDWTGHPSSHILEVGWDEVDLIFERHGYRIDHHWNHGRWYVQ